MSFQISTIYYFRSLPIITLANESQATANGLCQAIALPSLTFISALHLLVEYPKNLTV